MIDNAFITWASQILADTHHGLSTSEIVALLSDYSVRYNIPIPHNVYPFTKMGINKRTILAENLRQFQPEQQYNIIKDLCGLEKFSNNENVKNLLHKLVSQYPEYSNIEENIHESVPETKDWLDEYPIAQTHYKSALEKRNNNLFPRNSLDDMRCSLEELLKQILGNKKSLENQESELGKFLDKKGISNEIKNLYINIMMKFFKNYQNNNVKHETKFKDIEVDFIIEQTAILMRLLIKSHKSI